MAFKMNSPYGKGSHDTSSKHGTNVNYKNSGMKDHLGNAVGMNKGGGPPFLGKLAKGAGKLLKGAAKFGAFGPLGMIGSHLMDKNKAKQGAAADPTAMGNVGGAAAEGQTPAAPPAPAAPGAAPVDATQMEEPGVQMKKDLKTIPPKGKRKMDPGTRKKMISAMEEAKKKTKGKGKNETKK